MSSTVNQTAAAFGAGRFAGSCRKGPLTADEIIEIEAHRAKARPTPWQALAAQYGRPVADLQALMGAPRPSGIIREVDSEPTAPPVRVRDRTAKHDARIKTLWENGVGVNDICRTLGIGQTTLNTCRLRLGLKSRSVGQPGITWTPEADEILIREYIVAGRTSSAVAKMLGVSRGSLVGRVHKLGLSKNIPTRRHAA